MQRKISAVCVLLGFLFMGGGLGATSLYTEMKKININVKYSVTALIDLLGFSSHLEIGNYDFRTNIGQEAIKRLLVLEKTLSFLSEEKKKCPQVYPHKYYLQRINDSIILTMDLPDFLTPGVGETIRNGYSAYDLTEQFSEEELRTEETFVKAYELKKIKSRKDLLKFVGLIARMHNYINYIEKENYFPGAKTIISTGFRLPFIFDNVEDYFSANFSFSNCFLAEKQLKSNNLFIDENILRIIAEDKYARNLIKYAYLKREIAPFDISYDYKETDYIPDRVKVTKCYEIEMFRKQFFFRELNPTPLTYLQQLELLNDFLSGAKNPKTDFSVFLNQLNSIKNGIEVKEIEGKQFKNLWILNTRADISEDIRIFSEILENGKSFTADEKRKYVINNSIYGV